jgi:hypothetical protein
MRVEGLDCFNQKPSSIVTSVFFITNRPLGAQFILDECIGLIWSDRVNWARSMGLSWWFAFSFPEDRASSSRSGFERRLISLIFAGRNRIIMIRRELPLTVIASPVEPVA